MNSFPQLAPGSIVLNQDPDAPQSGNVIPAPDDKPHRGFVWVHWADGKIELEDPADLTLTAQVRWEPTNA